MYIGRVILCPIYTEDYPSRSTITMDIASKLANHEDYLQPGDALPSHSLVHTN